MAPPEAIITPDKLHAYKCLVDYLGLEGICGAAEKSSDLPSVACQLRKEQEKKRNAYASQLPVNERPTTCQPTYVSNNAIVTQSMAKWQWVPCVTPIKNVTQLQMLVLTCQQSKHTSSWRTDHYRFVCIAKDTPTNGYDPSQSAFGWTQAGFWAAVVAKHTDHVVPMPFLRHMVAQCDSPG